MAVVKKYNIKRHFESNHRSLNQTYPIGSDLRREYLRKMKSSFGMQLNLFRRVNTEMEEAIAFLLAKKKKPFSDAEEIIRPTLDIIGKRISKDSCVDKLAAVPLSRATVTRRSKSFAENIREQLNEIGKACKFFSLYMDESTDVCHISQLAIFVRAVDDDFVVTEELLQLKALHGTTKGSDLFSALKCCVETSSFQWEKLESVCTDGAPALIAHTKGCVAILEKFLHRSILKYHCLIHQEALVGKQMNLAHVMDVVVKSVNKIMARTLYHRQFKVILAALEEEYSDLILHNNVRWLSRGKVLARFWSLEEHVLEFLKENKELENERKSLKNGDWLNDFAFLIDITTMLSDLNLRLEGRDKLFANIASDIESFELKLDLLVKDVEGGNSL